VKGFVAGRTVVRRYWRAGRIGFLNAMRVVADDERGLRLWQPAGTKYWRLMTPDGRTHHDGTIDQLGDLTLTELTWRGSDMLVFMPLGEAWSVWFFFAPGAAFKEWYVNLEDPYRRWDDGGAAGVDTADHALDIRVAADGRWRWKDEEEFSAKTGHPDYWSSAHAADIRATGERLVELIEAAGFPFDGTWCDFRPGPSWPTPQRPRGWDRPRA
jgi:hypothetical protein